MTTIKLSGFNELIAELEKTEKDLDKNARRLADKAGEIIQSELVEAMQKADVSPNLIKRLPPYQVTQKGNVTTARAGYIPTEYDPDNLSDFYKALFINVGTPHREPTQIEGRDFVAKAKNAAKKRLNTLSAETLKTMTKGLKK